MKTWKTYLDSFKLNQSHLYLLLTDMVVFYLIFYLFTTLSKYVQNKSIEVLQGRSVEQIQEMLASMNPEQVLPFVNSLKLFLVTSIGALIFLIIFSYLFYSLSRAFIWNHLAKKKLTKKTYWRWNVLNLSLVIPLFLIGLVYFIVKLIFNALVNWVLKLLPISVISHPTFIENTKLILNGSFGILFIVATAIIIFLVYYQFTLKYKVWDSLGKGFGLFKQKWKTLWKVVFLGTLTALLLTLVTLPLKKSFAYSSSWIMFIGLASSALLMAWLRVYLLKTLDHGHQ